MNLATNTTQFLSLSLIKKLMMITILLFSTYYGELFAQGYNCEKYSLPPSTTGFGGAINITNKFIGDNATNTQNGYSLVNSIFYITGKKMVVRPSIPANATTISGTTLINIDLRPVTGYTTITKIVIEDCILVGGNNAILIKAGIADSHELTIRNCRFYGYSAFDPTSDPRTVPGMAIEDHFGKNISIEHCYIEQINGILIDKFKGTGATGQRITVRYNKAKNLDARYPGNGTTFLGSDHDGGDAHFCQLDARGAGTPAWYASNVELAWNEMITWPNQGSGGDYFSFSGIGGTSASKINCHHNYIQGAYPTCANYTSYSGSGITTDLNDSTAYINIHHNQLVACHNGAINTPNGHDITVDSNRIINASTWRHTPTDDPNNWDPTENYTPVYTIGIQQKNTTPTRYNIVYSNNVVGVRHHSPTIKRPVYDRNDWDTTSSATEILANNVHYRTSPLMTRADEDAEYVSWLKALKANGYSVGPFYQYEAENVYVVSNDVTPANISQITCTGTLSNDKGVWLHEAGDAIQLPFSLPQTGTYRLGVRVRSGYTNLAQSQIMWPSYSFTVNGGTQSFTGDTSTVSKTLSSCMGSSYWGTMYSSNLVLNAGSNNIVVSSSGTNRGVDFLTVEFVASGARMASESVEYFPTVTLYPNPFEDKLTVDLGEKAKGTYQVAIVDALGHSFYAQEHHLKENQSQLQLQLAAGVMQPGLYFVRVNHDGQLPKVMKVIKQP